jgi:lipopolysaccharide assembly LptE-like protein
VKIFCALLLAFSLGGCAGYHIGPVKPYYLRSVHSLAVPVIKNDTYLPRISVLITNSIIKQFQQDGTYRITGKDDADAILVAEVERIDRGPVRSVRGNVLATVEFNLVMRLRYTLLDRDGKVLSPPQSVYGTTTFFVGDDITSDERQALPIAAEELAVRLVSQLSEGW